MLATIAKANQGPAQLLFFVAVILAAVAVVVSVVEKAWPAALAVAAVGFIAVGLLYHA